MTPYPLLFEPIFRPTVWGGRRLERMGKRLPPGNPGQPPPAIGESWEVADVPGLGREQQSVIRSGSLRGMTLHDAIASHRDLIVGHARSFVSNSGDDPREGAHFPLLLKLLDARQSLSVQVHPSHDYACSHPGSLPKSEAWIVLEADEGATIYRGLREGLNAAMLRKHIADGRIVDDLIAMPARVGQCIYLPTGTVHALGAGTVVAEIQTPGDTTFRLHDWGRAGRQMHIEEGLACIDFERPVPAQPGARPREPWRVGSLTTTELLAVDEFTIERLDAADVVELPIVTSGLPLVWLVIAGSARVESSSHEAVDLPLGTTTLLPAALEDSLATLAPGTSILKFTPPSPTRGMLA